MKAGAYLNLEVCRVMVAGLDQSQECAELAFCGSLRLLRMVTGQVHQPQASNLHKSNSSRKENV